MKKLIALLASLALVMVFSVGCKPKEQLHPKLQLRQKRQLHLKKHLKEQPCLKRHLRNQLIKKNLQGWAYAHP
jgi:hypothetical protein